MGVHFFRFTDLAMYSMDYLSLLTLQCQALLVIEVYVSSDTSCRLFNFLKRHLLRFG